MPQCRRRGAVPKAAPKSIKQHTDHIHDLYTNTESGCYDTHTHVLAWQVADSVSHKKFLNTEKELLEPVKNSMWRWQKGQSAGDERRPVRTTKLYVKGRTGDLLWREEPHKAMSSNAIKAKDYLGNGFRGSKFGYRCRTGAPWAATGSKGI